MDNNITKFTINKKNNNHKILEEIKIDLIIYNKIIIGDILLNKLIKIYSESNDDNRIKYLFTLLYYISNVKNNELLFNIKNELNFKTLIDKMILNGILDNTILNLSSIFI